MTNAFNVNTACSYVGGNQYLYFTIFEFAQCSLALTLAFTTMNSICLETSPDQFLT